MKCLKVVATQQMHEYSTQRVRTHREVGKVGCRGLTAPRVLTFSWQALVQLGFAAHEEGACLVKLGACYDEISGLWAEQGGREWRPVYNTMHDFRGMTADWHKILSQYAGVRGQDGVQEETRSDRPVQALTLT